MGGLLRLCVVVRSCPGVKTSVGPGFADYCDPRIYTEVTSFSFFHPGLFSRFCCFYHLRPNVFTVNVVHYVWILFFLFRPLTPVIQVTRSCEGAQSMFFVLTTQFYFFRRLTPVIQVTRSCERARPQVPFQFSLLRLVSLWGFYVWVLS